MQTVSLFLLWSGLVTGLATPSSPPSCRFALDWTQDEVAKNSDKFEWDLLYWEGQFHQNDVSYNSENGMSYDGTQLDWVTGERTKKHPFSAASKEVKKKQNTHMLVLELSKKLTTEQALQIMVYAHAIAGSPKAARFLSPGEPKKAPKLAASIMETKLKTYLQFNATYPGFGGFIPWMTTSSQNIEPTWDWVNRVPGLDNG